MDRHRLWRIVERNFEELQAIAPEGYEVIAEAFVSGREDPIVIGTVETSRSPEVPWIMLNNVAVDPKGRSSDQCFVFVQEELVQRVELHFRRKQGSARVGFSQRELAE